jgi:formylglycine-generating enzyme required for sulfatase activity
MAGNVWEWTHSLLEMYPYKIDDGREDEADFGHRVSRGGSFKSHEEFVHCYCRNFKDILEFLFKSPMGFRVVAAPEFS